MIGLRQSTRFLNRSMQSQGRYGSMIKTTQRGFAGGAEKPAMSADNTDFDILFVGKCDANIVHQYKLIPSFDLNKYGSFSQVEEEPLDS